jgi:hypothetical protein
MTKLSFILVGVLAVAGAGCKKKAGGGADCDTAINHSMEMSKADMAKMGVDDAMMGKMKDLGIKHCKDDKWSDDAVKCMVDAKTMSDSQACYGKLTQDQRDKMNKAAMELAPAPTPTEGAGSGAPAQGSQGSAELASGAAPAEQPGSAAAGSAGSAAAGSAAGSATP